MYTLIVVLILIVSILLGLIVLVQNSKGGGLVSNFGGANQVMGVRQTTDFLEKATWTMAAILVVLCLISSVTIPKNVKSGDAFQSEIAKPMEAPMAPAAAESALPMEEAVETAEPAAETPAEAE
ncbi:MAG: preprotein translocase subunit SecG [Bacteroidales bacterium]|nr:preprotein translocase subunit SecG [Bacteroidales bacterium]